MSWTKDNGKFAKDAAEQALLQANYLDEKKPLIDKFTDEQTNLQAQINQLVADGDSSPEAAQARVGVDDTAYSTLKARLDAENAQVTQQLAQIKHLGKYLAGRLNGGIVKIKTVGDSITSGHGASGYATPNTNPVIFTDGSTTYYEGSHDTQAWVNLMRNFVLSKNASNEFKNWGIGGMYAGWWNARKHHFTDEDIIFVMLGTNDRVNSLSLEHFKTQYTQFLQHLVNVSNYVVVMVANPNASDAEMTTANHKFSQAEVNNAVKDICLELGLPCISHYDAYMKFSEANATFDKLLADGIHPSDDGHRLIWETIQASLNVYDLTYQETKQKSQVAVTPDNFIDFMRKFASGNKVVSNNKILNPIFDTWTDATTPANGTKSNVNAERVPSLAKGTHALKLTPSATNGFYTSTFTSAYPDKDLQVLIIYEAVGVNRLQILQTGNTSQPLNTTLPSGKNVLTFDVKLHDDFANTIAYRVYPNISQVDGGYLIIDTILVIPKSQLSEGYFVVDLPLPTNQYAIAKISTRQTIPNDVATFLKLDTITPYNGMTVSLDSVGRFVLPKGCYVIDAYVQMQSSAAAVGYRQIASDVYSQRFPATNDIEPILHLSRFAEVTVDGGVLSVTVRHTQGTNLDVLTGQTNVIIRRVY